MQDRKTAKIIDAVKNMTEQEASILEAFISNLLAEKEIPDKKG